MTKAESAVDDEPTAKASENESAFLQQFARATARNSEASEKGLFDNVGDVALDEAMLAGKATLDGAGLVVDTVTDTVSKVPVVGDVFGTMIRGDPAKEIKFESAFDDERKPENVFDDLSKETGKIAQALWCRSFPSWVRSWVSDP